MFGDNQFTQSLAKIGDFLNNKKPPKEMTTVPFALAEEFYTTGGSIAQNWYKQRPYAFVFQSQKGEKKTFYLPIAPSNITINTHWATNVITTMYGTVEEHSEQRYYDITIQGTTGMMPRYYDVQDEQAKKDSKELKKIGREGFAVKQSLANQAGGFFKRTLAVIENAVNQAAEVLSGPDRPTTGVDLQKTGYVAFHNFYKFLLAYKKDAASAGIRKTEKGKSAHPLRFVNYKDNNQYDVSVQQFQLTRNADQPFLYNYNIVLRAYNLRDADSQEISADVSDRSAELGLDGIETSFLAKMANKAAQAKRAAYSAVGAAKGFGS